jgi:D-alanyl-D-alanine-carboxypeptidase/D-alanyl-D-alanine-endopeptidase
MKSSAFRRAGHGSPTREEGQVMVWHRWLVCTVLLGACAGDTLAGSRDLESDVLASALEDDQAAQWDEIGRIVSEAAERHGVPAMSLTVYDADDTQVFSHLYNDFDLDKRVAVASASKLVAGLVMFALIGKNKLSLDSTTREVLRFRGVQGDITLRDLLSFTSGLAPTADCISEPDTTLAACVKAIGRSTPVDVPGQVFDYNSTHLAVAGGMAEVAGDASFNDLFRTLMADRLQIHPKALFYTTPRRPEATDNPLVAGGLSISVNDYAKLLGLAFHRGRTEKLSIVTPEQSIELFDEAAREPYPDVEIDYSPMTALRLPFRYGLTSWLECRTPEDGCSVVSSPGKYGFTPWIDRHNGYYAILGMELEGSDGDVVSFSVDLQQRLKPLIVRALSGDQPQHRN